MFNLKRLLPFFNVDGGMSGAVQETDTQTDADTVNDEAKGADEPKTGEDVKTEAQKIADAMVAKKLKNMPSKEELTAFKKWQDEQKSEDEKLIEAQKAIETAKAEIAVKETKAQAMISAISAGIKPQHIEDAVILASARVTEETSIDDAIKLVAKNNPSWTLAVGLPGNGGNPASKKLEDKTVGDEILAKIYGKN